MGSSRPPPPQAPSRSAPPRSAAATRRRSSLMPGPWGCGAGGRRVDPRAQRADRRRRVRLAIDLGPRHRDGDAVLRHRRDVGRPDAAVHLDVGCKTASRDRVAQLRRLAQRGGNERLSAPARIDRHHEDEVEIGQHVLEHRHRRRRIERHSGAHAARAQVRDQTVDVERRFPVNRDAGGACSDVFVEQPLGVRHHQVNVERQAGAASERSHHRDAEAEVGHEVAVHDVDVEQIGTAGFGRADRAAQIEQIGGQERRRDLQRPTSAMRSPPATTSEITSRRRSRCPGSGCWRSTIPGAAPS